MEYWGPLFEGLVKCSLKPLIKNSISLNRLVTSNDYGTNFSTAEVKENGQFEIFCSV